MPKNTSRRDFVKSTGAVGAMASGAAALGAGATANAHFGGRRRFRNPDPAHIIPLRFGFFVRPTGGDDRDNIEWALKNTPRRGTVRLSEGVFKIGSPVVVADFDGRLIGAGAARTTITCTDEYSLEVWEAPGGPKDNGAPKPPPFPRVFYEGSKTRTPPVLIQFYKTPLKPGESPRSRANRIAVRNLRCRGAMYGEPWMFGDEVLCVSILNVQDWNDPETPQITTRQDVLVSGVFVDGYASPEFGPFENACACITVAGNVVHTANYDLNGEIDGDAFGIANGGFLDLTPAEGNVTIESCKFKNCRVGPGVIGYKNGAIRLANITTDGCRGNCLQLFENSGMSIHVTGNDLFCDSFLLPPELAGGATDTPSSLGCVVAFQGLFATLGLPANVRWASLAFDPAAHAAHPEAGPLGTWRPQGPSSAPLPSTLWITRNSCRSSLTENTYCFHVIDLSRFAFGMEAVSAVIQRNDCADSQTCISLEHVPNALVRHNRCSSQAFGVELYNSANALVFGNQFHFPSGVDACEIRQLSIGDKIDFSRVTPGAGACVSQ